MVKDTLATVKLEQNKFDELVNSKKGTNTMAKEKKRLSKKAKEALKILENSKLLENSKTINESKADQTFKSADSSAKTATAHKIRPNKKRG